MLNKREYAMAQELARELTIVEEKKKVAERRAMREWQRRANQEAMESLGRSIRNVRNAYIEGFVKPINNALTAMQKGYLGK